MTSHCRGAVLVVDDDQTVLQVVSAYLEEAGYRTQSAATGPVALRMAEEERFDLVVLDLMLPGVGGFDVMRRMRSSAPDGGPSVILLTAKGQASDRVTGLRLGADDYVAKPFSPAELVARVDAVLRRAVRSSEPEPAITFAAGLEIDPEARRVTVGATEIALTQREYDLLLFLARHPGKVFSREQLMEEVWQSTFVDDTRTVPVHVRRLRTKIEVDPSEPRWLQTVWGVGYRFSP